MNPEQTSRKQPCLDFCWGSGNDFLLWKKFSKKKPNVYLPGEIQSQTIINRGILINWDACIGRDSDTLRSFAQNLYQFHMNKFEIQQTVVDEKQQQLRLLVKIKEANASYCNALARTYDGYHKDGNEDKETEYLQYFLTWKLADIFYMRESNFSKTQEYAAWIKHFTDIQMMKKNIEDEERCDWDSLNFFLSLGDIENVIIILKNLKADSQSDNSNIEFAIYETIEALKKKIKYYKGNDCVFNDKPSFLDLFNKEKSKFNNILLKWQSELDPQHKFIKFLKVLTGNIEAIEEASGGDWKRFLNLIFLFFYPFVEKQVLENVMDSYNKKYELFDSDRVFISIIVNPRAFQFLESIFEHLPAWFTFHLSDMLYLFKQIPLEPLLFNEDDDAPEITFADMVLQKMLGFLIQSKAPYDVIKYYVSYIFHQYAADVEGRISEEYIAFIEQIVISRMNSYDDQQIQIYLQELNDPIFREIEEFNQELFANLRSSLLKRRARNYINAVSLDQYKITQGLKIIAELGDPVFANQFGGQLTQEFEEEGNQDVAKVLFKLESEGSEVFQISEYLSFLLKYCKFRKAINELGTSGNAVAEAKALLIDMILEKSAPENMRLLVLNYAIDLFENDNAKFTSDQIHAFIDQLANVENSLKYQDAKEQGVTRKIVHSIKIGLMRSLSKSVLCE